MTFVERMFKLCSWAIQAENVLSLLTFGSFVHKLSPLCWLASQETESYEKFPQLAQIAPRYSLPLVSSPIRLWTLNPVNKMPWSCGAVVSMVRKRRNLPGASLVCCNRCQPPAVWNVRGCPKCDGRPWRGGNEKRHGNLRECGYTRCGAPGAVLPLGAIPQRPGEISSNLDVASLLC